MAKIFYLSEIVQFAIEREKESYALYKELSKKSNTEDLKKFFSLLMEEEKKHETFYTKLLDTVPKEQSPGVKEDSEYSAYMQELIRVNRSTPPLDLDKIAEVKEAIDYAIAREKDAVLFYVGLKNFLPTTNNPTIDATGIHPVTQDLSSSYDNEEIDIIIKEEAKHVAQLLLLKQRL